MNYLSHDKLVIIGAAGMIGSNMAQTAASLRLTPNLCLYDPYAQGLEGVVEEIRHCAFQNLNLTFTTDIVEALKDAHYIVSSGGAPRKEGMTREDLLEGNAKIAANLGNNIKKYCPDVKHVVIIFNPADVTGLVTLVYSGLKPTQVTTLAALDTTRLQSELAKYFGVLQSEVTGCRIYGGHGEQMAVFTSSAKIKGIPLTKLIGTNQLPQQEWEALCQRVIKGGANIIKLRGRSSFQSPAHVSIEMIAATMGGTPFSKPVGCYICNEEYKNVMMAYETLLDKNGVHIMEVKGLPEEKKDLNKSYQHLVGMRQTLIEKGILPSIEEWHQLNPNL